MLGNKQVNTKGSVNVREIPVDEVNRKARESYMPSIGNVIGYNDNGVTAITTHRNFSAVPSDNSDTARRVNGLHGPVKTFGRSDTQFAKQNDTTVKTTNLQDLFSSGSNKLKKIVTADVKPVSNATSQPTPVINTDDIMMNSINQIKSEMREKIKNIPQEQLPIVREKLIEEIKQNPELSKEFASNQPVINTNCNSDLTLFYDKEGKYKLFSNIRLGLYDDFKEELTERGFGKSATVAGISTLDRLKKYFYLLHSVNLEGFTVLQYACYYNRLDIVILILSYLVAGETNYVQNYINYYNKNANGRAIDLIDKSGGMGIKSTAAKGANLVKRTLKNAVSLNVFGLVGDIGKNLVKGVSSGVISSKQAIEILLKQFGSKEKGKEPDNDVVTISNLFDKNIFSHPYNRNNINKVASQPVIGQPQQSIAGQPQQSIAGQPQQSIAGQSPPVIGQQSIAGQPQQSIAGQSPPVIGQQSIAGQPQQSIAGQSPPVIGQQPVITQQPKTNSWLSSFKRPFTIETKEQVQPQTKPSKKPTEIIIENYNKYMKRQIEIQNTPESFNDEKTDQETDQEIEKTLNHNEYKDYTNLIYVKHQTSITTNNGKTIQLIPYKLNKIQVRPHEDNSIKFFIIEQSIDPTPKKEVIVWEKEITEDYINANFKYTLDRSDYIKYFARKQGNVIQVIYKGNGIPDLTHDEIYRVQYSNNKYNIFMNTTDQIIRTTPLSVIDDDTVINNNFTLILDDPQIQKGYQDIENLYKENENKPLMTSIPGLPDDKKKEIGLHSVETGKKKKGGKYKSRRYKKVNKRFTRRKAWQ
jgi:hypothetical protein